MSAELPANVRRLFPRGAGNMTDEQWIKLLAIVDDDEPRFQINFPDGPGQSVRVIEHGASPRGHVIRADGDVTSVVLTGDDDG